MNRPRMSRTTPCSRIFCCRWPKAWSTAVHRERLRTLFRHMTVAVFWCAGKARETNAPVCARNVRKLCRLWSYRFRQTAARRFLWRAAWPGFPFLERTSGDASRSPDPWNAKRRVTLFVSLLPCAKCDWF